MNTLMKLAPGTQPTEHDKIHRACPMDSILRVLMGPWTTYVLWLLHSQGPQRFGQLRRAVPGISAKVLTERLRHLEAQGLVHRDYVPSVPPAVTYSLTARGTSLRHVLDGLDALARQWHDEDQDRAALARHASESIDDYDHVGG